MGTRADFYVGRGETAEWLGSITWDGYPDGIAESVFDCATEDMYRIEITAFFAGRDDVTYPNEPWPWPWETSATTDYAYAFDGGTVWGSSFGDAWFEVDPSQDSYGEPEENDGPKAAFPDMSDRKGDINHIMRKSGMIIVSFPTDSAGE